MKKLSGSLKNGGNQWLDNLLDGKARVILPRGVQNTSP